MVGVCLELNTLQLLWQLGAVLYINQLRREVWTKLGSAPSRSLAGPGSGKDGRWTTETRRQDILTPVTSEISSWHGLQDDLTSPKAGRAPQQSIGLLASKSPTTPITRTLPGTTDERSHGTASAQWYCQGPKAESHSSLVPAFGAWVLLDVALSSYFKLSSASS